MKTLFITISLLTPICTNVSAQNKSRIFLGYNTCNEFYGGFQFPGDSAKVIVELGYQFALTQEYRTNTGGLYNLPRLFPTNNASGIRFRIGYQIPTHNKSNKFSSIQFEYQNLQSNNYIYSEGGTFATGGGEYSEFTDASAKYGLKFSNGIPLIGNSVFFVYSFGAYYMEITRKYSIDGTYYKKTPSDREEDIQKFTMQFNVGLRVYVF